MSAFIAVRLYEIRELAVVSSYEWFATPQMWCCRVNAKCTGSHQTSVILHEEVCWLFCKTRRQNPYS